MTTRLRDLLFRDFITLQRGFDLPAKQRIAGQYPVVASTSVSGTHNEFKVHSPGVVTGRSGSLGEVLYVEEPFWPLNTTLWVKDFKGNLPRYVYYLLRTLDLEHFNSGAGVPTLNRNDLDTLQIRIHNLEGQRKVVSVLSAYDDLIENNTRRIQILEEMAQAIYREWFVNFRFPEHEKVGMVDSPLGKIPEGWETKPFSSVASFTNGYAFKPKHWGDSGKPIVKIAELKKGVTTSTPRHHGEDIAPKYQIQDGDLLFSWSADLNAYIWSGGKALLNQHLFNVVPKDDISRIFLFYALKDRMQEFRSRSQGTTMKHIKRSALDEVQFMIPPPALRFDFERCVEPMIGQVENLRTKNTNLRRTRDLLLPKLISGEVSVEDMEIESARSRSRARSSVFTAT